jgi:hypothetical protein
MGKPPEKIFYVGDIIVPALAGARQGNTSFFGWLPMSYLT